MNGSTRPRASVYFVPRSRASSRSVRNTQRVAFRDLVAVLVEEVDVVDLLERAAGERVLCSIRSFRCACVVMTSLRSTGLCQVQSAPAHMAWTPDRPPQ